MARSLFARIFSRDRGDNEWKEHLQTGATEGPPSAMEHLALGTSQRKDPWMVEWERRRQDVSDQYWRDKRRLHHEQRRAEREMKRELEREQQDIERYYRLHELKRDDPRRARAEREAYRKVQLAQRQIQRKHREQWQRNMRELQLARDQQKRLVTKDMKREYKESREVPGEETGPLGPTPPPGPSSASGM